MAKFSIEGTKTDPSAGLGVLGLLQDGTTQRRGKVYDLIVGCSGTPGDNAWVWNIVRGTTGLGTSTPVTPEPLDPADPSGLLDAGDQYTVNPTLAGILLSIALNGRATFRWVAAPGSELVLAATANLSILARTPTAPALAAEATMLYEEQ